VIWETGIEFKNYDGTTIVGQIDIDPITNLSIFRSKPSLITPTSVSIPQKLITSIDDPLELVDLQKIALPNYFQYGTRRVGTAYDLLSDLNTNTRIETQDINFPRFGCIYCGELSHTSNNCPHSLSRFQISTSGLSTPVLKDGYGWPSNQTENIRSITWLQEQQKI